MRQLAPCQLIAGVLYHQQDFRLVCTEDTNFAMTMIAIGGFFLYPLGCPALYYIVLRRNAHKLQVEVCSDPSPPPNELTLMAVHTVDHMQGSKAADRYGFIYERYQPEFFWWETLEETRTLTL
jgi:hypothetical protein